MKTKRVIVEKYDPAWQQDFEKIKIEITAALEGLFIAVEHVGSTAVEGLSAKPIIDIDVVIEKEELLDKVIERLHRIGYIHEGDLGIEGREAFCYENKPFLKEHHLYVCAKSSQELHRHITFRDYLRSHPEAVKEYSRVKEEGARRYSDDITGYIAFKSECIQKIYMLCGLVGKHQTESA